MESKLIIASAGSGKTTYIVREALKIKKERVLITTFTDANENEIRKKFIQLNSFIPPNVTIQTWFSFLLQHGVKPYQSKIYDENVNGLLLVNAQSGTFEKNGNVIFYPESDAKRYYFSNDMKIYSDKISKFVFRVNELSSGDLFNRLSRIFPYIFIDEVQDMAGYDLDLIKLMMSSSNVIMVGDPRQVTYITHREQRNKKYLNGNIEGYIQDKCSECNVDIDKDMLNINYRCVESICKLANKLYPSYSECKCQQMSLSDHTGVFWVKKEDVAGYLQKYKPVQLRNAKSVQVDNAFPVRNFGEVKGLSFDRALIYPTKPMLDWLEDPSSGLQDSSRAKFYVALTRARYSVGIVYDAKRKKAIEGIGFYQP